MGKKEDWCSQKGLEARQRGMKKKESKGRKCLYCMGFGLGAIVFIIFAGLHSWRSSNAAKIQEELP